MRSLHQSAWLDSTRFNASYYCRAGASNTRRMLVMCLLYGASRRSQHTHAYTQLWTWTRDWTEPEPKPTQHTTMVAGSDWKKHQITVCCAHRLAPKNDRAIAISHITFVHSFALLSICIEPLTHRVFNSSSLLLSIWFLSVSLCFSSNSSRIRPTDRLFIHSDLVNNRFSSFRRSLFVKPAIRIRTTLQLSLSFRV